MGCKILHPFLKGEFMNHNETTRLSSEEINKHLGSDFKEFNIITFESVDSTNLYAKINADKVADKTVVIAEYQTGGRGRLGRDFHSPANNGIYMSMLLKKKSLPDDITLLTVGAASGVSKAIEETFDIDTRIKWVNDIFVNNKKVCGILTEMVGENIIIGIGVNLASSDAFPDELKNIAGALGVEISGRNKLIAAIIRIVFNEISNEPFDSVLDYYKNKSLVLNRNISFERNGENISGKVIDINEKGNLIVEKQNGENIIIHSGEIRLSLENLSDN